MARGKNYYRSVIEPFSPIASFSPRKNDYIVGFPPGKIVVGSTPLPSPEEWLYSRNSLPKE
jgi:hypothetical protein